MAATNGRESLSCNEIVSIKSSPMGVYTRTREREIAVSQKALPGDTHGTVCYLASRMFVPPSVLSAYDFQEYIY